ncbi:pentapeptide repeat-containing protein [Streptomyces sp. NPDC058128]|uniref:pentapeptide repeat-containing protein n=1 Tax=Streptomyces sp. NPDC058128 TaxID=3346352 RepID=UPI0036E7C13E
MREASLWGALLSGCDLRGADPTGAGSPAGGDPARRPTRGGHRMAVRGGRHRIGGHAYQCGCGP